MNKALNIHDLVEECRIHEEDVRPQRTSYLRRFFAILPTTTSDWEEISIPSVEEKFMHNLRESRMIVFDNLKKQFKCSALVSNCSKCLGGFFEECLIDEKQIITKDFRTLKTSSVIQTPENMFDQSDDYPFDFQFLQRILNTNSYTTPKDYNMLII